MPNTNTFKEVGAVAYALLRAFLVSGGLYLASRKYQKLKVETHTPSTSPARKSGMGPENSVEAFKEFFRGNLRGTWDNAVFTVTPADTAVSFQQDGTAWVCSGAAGLLGGPTEFKWRQTGDYAIEVAEEGSDDWTALEYSFSKNEGRVSIFFDPAVEEAGWVYEFAYECLPFSGL